VVGIRDFNSPYSAVKEEFRPATAEEYRRALSEVRKEKDMEVIISEGYRDGVLVLTFRRKDGSFSVAAFKEGRRIQ
jgi:1,4-dihydroxy-2-naphthoyl-CoA synthase